jgi:hypothetical protein
VSQESRAMLALTQSMAPVLDSIGEASSFFSEGFVSQWDFPRFQDKGVQHGEGCPFSASAFGV